MNKKIAWLPALCIFTLVLAACTASGGQNTTAVPSQGAAATSAVVPSLAPAATSAPSMAPSLAPSMVATGGAATPVATAQPVAKTNGLAEVLSYPVVDANANPVGTIDDFIVNLCTDRILYLVMTPDPALKLTTTNPLIVPFEAVKASAPGTETSDFTLNVDPTKLAGAPSADPATLDLNAPTWEAAVTQFWSGLATVTQTSACTPAVSAGAAGTPGAEATTSSTSAPVATVAAPATSATAASTGSAVSADGIQIAFARALLRAAVQDASGSVQGKVNGAIVDPASGLLQYFVLQPTVSPSPGNLIPVPATAFSLRHEGTGADQAEVLVLKVPSVAFSGAPPVNMRNVGDASWEAATDQYWSKYIQVAPTEMVPTQLTPTP